MDARTLARAPRELRTRRLLLQAPRVAHAAAMVDFFNASLAGWPFIHWPKHARDIAWAEHFCAKGLELVDSGDNLIFDVLQPQPDGARIVGRIDVHSFDFDAPRGEIGYVGDPRLSGHGLVHEAVAAVVELGFALGLARIEAISDVRNERAIAFALGLGFRREGVVRHRERDPGGVLCDQVMLARLPADAPPSPSPSPPPSRPAVAVAPGSADAF